LTAIYTVVGLFVLSGVVFTAYLFITYWPVFLALALGGFAFYWYTKSPAALERDARNRTAKILNQAATIDPQFPSAHDFSHQVISKLLEERDRSAYPCYPVAVSLMHAADVLYEAEAFTLAAIAPPPPVLDSIEGARYRDRTSQHLVKLNNPSTLGIVYETLNESFTSFVHALPPAALQPAQELVDTVWALSDGLDRPPVLSVPLIDVLPHVAQRIEDLIVPFYSDKVHSLGLFQELRGQLDRNLHAVSGVPFDIVNKDSPKLIMPSQNDASPCDLVHDYLHHTPLEKVFTTDVPFQIPQQSRFEHMHIIAGTGWGKSQALQHLLLSDLQQPDPPALVVIDSQGEMLKKIAHLAIFDNKFKDKLIYVDPTDIDHPPALNMFDVSHLDQYSKSKREQFINGLIELLEYVFAGLLKAELTQKQNVLFRYALRLMLHVPGATLTDLVKFLNDPTPYIHYASELSETAQDFFHSEFSDKSYMQTRQQIRRRLFGVLENDAFRRMFTAPKNRLNMLEALNNGSIILVDTAKSHLKEDASSLLGRYFIALTLQAAIERSDVFARERKSAFLYIDEAGEYFDDNIDTFLNEARKRRVGCVMAHQYLDQLTPQLRSSIATNTSIKLAGGISDRDSKFLAPEMRTSSDFIAAQKKDRDRTSFACYVRNFTPQAISITVPFGTLERQPTMSTTAYERLCQSNRARISMSTDPIVRLSASDLPWKLDPSPPPQPTATSRG
jgi:hypothetical protein